MHPVLLKNITDIRLTEDDGKSIDFKNVFVQGNKIKLSEDQTYELYKMMSENNAIRVMVSTTDQSYLHKWLLGSQGMYGFAIETAGFVNMYKECYNPSI